jgi:hypothetical protein
VNTPVGEGARLMLAAQFSTGPEQASGGELPP